MVRTLKASLKSMIIFLLTNFTNLRSEKDTDFKDSNIYWKSFIYGERKALSKLFVLFYMDLYCYGLKLSSDKNLVEDTIQELFLRLWERRESLKEIESVKLYLLKSIRRAIIKKEQSDRSRYKRNFEYVQYHPEESISPESDLMKSEFKNDKNNFLQACIKNMTKKQREVMFLRYFEGMSNEEIAQILNITYQRVKNIIHEAIERIRSNVHNQKY